MHSQASAYPQSQQSAFFKVLFHDDRQSHYIISTDAGGTWHDTALKKQVLGAFSFHDNANYYITHNGFSGKRRTADRARQLNAMFFDIDCHSKTPVEAQVLVALALDALNAQFAAGALPHPNLVVNSGRGLHLYYVLERSIPCRFRGAGAVNTKGIEYFADVKLRLAQAIDQALCGLDGISVDRAALDVARVGRVPGTVNQKTGQRSSLIYTNQAYYHLPDLDTFARRALSQNAECPTDKTPTLKPARRAASFIKFQPMLISRLNKVAELQEYRNFDCQGSRELMCFVHYNTGVQLFSRQDATDALHAFNKKFKHPLDSAELKSVTAAVDGVTNVRGESGYYILSAQTIIRLLALTEKEMRDLNFFSSKKFVDRQSAKKKTAEKKQARNSKIVELYTSENLTQAEVAQRVGCSARTVFAVLKEYNAKQANIKPSEPQKQLSPTSYMPTEKEPLKTAQNQYMQKNPVETIKTKVANFFDAHFAKNCPPCLGVVLRSFIFAPNFFATPLSFPLLE
jgi:DNA-binding XRE family transcriptional regulator